MRSVLTLGDTFLSRCDRDALIESEYNESSHFKKNACMVI